MFSDGRRRAWSFFPVYAPGIPVHRNVFFALFQGFLDYWVQDIRCHINVQCWGGRSKVLHGVLTLKSVCVAWAAEICRSISFTITNCSVI